MVRFSYVITHANQYIHGADGLATVSTALKYTKTPIKPESLGALGLETRVKYEVWHPSEKCDVI